MAEMLTILEIIKKTTEFFAGKGVENPRLNAELLVGHGLGLKRMQLYMQFERPLTSDELEKIRRARCDGSAIKLEGGLWQWTPSLAARITAAIESQLPPRRAR